MRWAVNGLPKHGPWTIGNLWRNLLGKSYKITWQQGHKNLSKYIDWINDCRVIVTCDSLGQAVAQALGKKVVTLYGPTNYVRMQGIPDVTVLPSTLKCPHMPCFLPVCKFDKFCMDYISPEKVAQICKDTVKMKEVLVTGGAGYVGAVLVPKLLAAGWKVNVIDLYLYGDVLTPHPNLVQIKGDIRDKDLLERCDARG